MFGLVSEKPVKPDRNNTKSLQRNTKSGDLYRQCFTRHSKKPKESGEYQYEWKFSVGKSISKLNVTRLQVCV